MKRNKNIIILASVVVVNLVLLGLFFVVVGIIKEKSEKSSIFSAELNGYLKKEVEINKIKNEIKNTKGDRLKLKKYFVDINDLPAFTKKIESLSKTSKVDSITINSLSQKGNILFLDFSASGTFENVLYLLRLVENIPFKINFKKVYLNKVNNINGKIVSNKWEGIFNVEIIGFLDNKNND